MNGFGTAGKSRSVAGSTGFAAKVSIKITNFACLSRSETGHDMQHGSLNIADCKE
jgi:hypothetical protein